MATSTRDGDAHDGESRLGQADDIANSQHDSTRLMKNSSIAVSLMTLFGFVKFREIAPVGP